MPRGKYVNHKGRTRQFTPTDQLQLELNMEQGQGEPHGKPDHEDEYQPAKNTGRGVFNPIQVFNPNHMPREKDRSLKDRKQKKVSQAQADLERLSIVRKEREAAAESRLAAKKAAFEAKASKLTSSLKKITKRCSVEEVNPMGVAIQGK